MRALTYHGPYTVSVDNMPGTHLGDIFGHEFMGRLSKRVWA